MQRRYLCLILAAVLVIQAAGRQEKSARCLQRKRGLRGRRRQP